MTDNREDETNREGKAPAAPPRWVFIQRNPKSGSGRGRDELLQLCRGLKARGFRVRMFDDRRRLDQRVSRSHPNDVRCLVAAGGDGTVADVASRHPQLPIAILPLGTENLLARYLAFPRRGRELAEVIADGRSAVLDTVMAGDQRFLIMLSSGIDADVVHAIHAARTGHIRRIGYLWPTLRAFLLSRPQRLRVVSADGGQEIRGSHIIVSNGPVYGFGLPFNPDARMDDGLLDVRAFTGTTRWQVFWHAVRLKLGFAERTSEVLRFRSSSVVLTSDSADDSARTQVDGDPGPGLPVTITIEPRSLRMIVPVR